MKNLIVYFQIMIAAVCFTSCAKDEVSEQEIVSGTLIESATGKPVPGAKLTLTQSSFNILLLGTNAAGSSYVVDTTESDANGNFKFKRTGGGSVTAYKSGYYCSVSAEPKDGKTEVTLYRNAYLKVNFKNKSGACGVFTDTKHEIGFLELAKGQDSTLTIATFVGDSTIKYDFHPRILTIDDRPTVDYWNQVKVTSNGYNLKLDHDSEWDNFVKLQPIGHDTTNLVIVY
jgi:hypothetical protein